MNTVSDCRQKFKPTSSKAKRLINTAYLKDCIKAKNMSLFQLAQKMGVPKTTISRFVNGQVQKPTLKMVYDVSRCLNADLRCLFEKDTEESTYENAYDIHKVNLVGGIKVPVLEWNEIDQWMSSKGQEIENKRTLWVNTLKPMSIRSFGLPSLAILEPEVPSGSVIIVNPDGKLVDQKWVLLTSMGKDPAIKRVIVDGSDRYLTPLITAANEKRIIRLTSEDFVVGTIEEAVLFL